MHAIRLHQVGPPSADDLVDVLGERVDPAWLGRPVVAHLGMVPGGYAEQAMTSVENLLPRDGLDAAAAVALVGTGRTAVAVLAPLLTTYPLAEAARAHRDLEERRTLGKVVLLSR